MKWLQSAGQDDCPLPAAEGSFLLDQEMVNKAVGMASARVP